MPAAAGKGKGTTPQKFAQKISGQRRTDRDRKDKMWAMQCTRDAKLLIDALRSAPATAFSPEALAAMKTLHTHIQDRPKHTYPMTPLEEATAILEGRMAPPSFAARKRGRPRRRDNYTTRLAPTPPMPTRASARGKAPAECEAGPAECEAGPAGVDPNEEVFESDEEGWD